MPPAGAAKVTRDIKSYKDLLVWQRGMALVKEAYLLTSKFPAEEKFGLTSQMRRAAVSVPSNIAEGHARQGTRNTSSFFRTPVDRLPNWRPRPFWQLASAIAGKKKRRQFWI
jgi:hypothetical protein